MKKLASALFLGLFIFFTISCDKEAEPTVRIEIQPEKGADFDEFMDWLEPVLKNSCACQPVTEINDNGNIVALVPVSEADRTREVLEFSAGTEIENQRFGFHIGRHGVLADEIVPGYMHVPFRDDPKKTLLVEIASVVKPGDVKNASPRSGPSGWEIIVEFSKDAAARINAFTTENIGKPLAIVLDGEILMAPIINAPFGEGCSITGNFTDKEAKGIADGLISPLPPPTRFTIKAP